MVFKEKEKEEQNFQRTYQLLSTDGFIVKVSIKRFWYQEGGLGHLYILAECQVSYDVFQAVHYDDGILAELHARHEAPRTGGAHS